MAHERPFQSLIIEITHHLAYLLWPMKGAKLMTTKEILVPGRVRHLPRSDWSWLDRRFLRQYSSQLSGDAVFLYLLLTAVSDKNGLSYYSDTSLALRLRTSEKAIAAARNELIMYDLVAYRNPLVQVLSLPAQIIERSARAQLTEILLKLDDDHAA
jgi:hypothetical protein